MIDLAGKKSIVLHNCGKRRAAAFHESLALCCMLQIVMAMIVHHNFHGSLHSSATSSHFADLTVPGKDRSGILPTINNKDNNILL